MNDQRNGHDFDFGGDGDGARGGGEVSGVGGARERDNKFLTRRRIKKNRIGWVFLKNEMDVIYTFENIWDFYFIFS